MATKPLGHKSYGSIGHLPGSRMGPGDHHVHAGQGEICCSKARDKHDVIVVQEKLDGTNVSVALIAGQLVPLTRSGYTAWETPYTQHKLFGKWVQENEERFRAILKEGERLCGEWLAQAHGTRYELDHEPFVAFDIMHDGHKRAPYREVQTRCIEGDFITPHLVHMGGPLSIEEAMRLLGTSGFHGALDPVEGAVWRVERQGKVDFLAKYVRPDKADGCYLPEKGTHDAEHWNWRPNRE